MKEKEGRVQNGLAGEIFEKKEKLAEKVLQVRVFDQRDRRVCVLAIAGEQMLRDGENHALSEVERGDLARLQRHQNRHQLEITRQSRANVDAGVDHSVVAQQIAAEHIECGDRLCEGSARLALAQNVADEIQRVGQQRIARVSIAAIQNHAEFFGRIAGILKIICTEEEYKFRSAS